MTGLNPQQPPPPQIFVAYLLHLRRTIRIGEPVVNPADTVTSPDTRDTVCSKITSCLVTCYQVMGHSLLSFKLTTIMINNSQFNLGYHVH